jgi:hypothetical protein
MGLCFPNFVGQKSLVVTCNYVARELGVPKMASIQEAKQRYAVCLSMESIHISSTLVNVSKSLMISLFSEILHFFLDSSVFRGSFLLQTYEKVSSVLAVWLL